MTEPTIGSFFGGGGGRSVSWKDKPIGTTVTGVIKLVHPPQQQTDPVTGEPQFKKNKQPKLAVRIDLDTAERDPSDPDDDGSRGLYVQGWMQGAVGDALKKVGKTVPEPGATLSVTLSDRTPNENAMLSPINKFTATYVPGVPGTAAFFTPPANGAAPAVDTLQRPAAITEEAWKQMDPATRKAVASTMTSDEPPF